MNHKIFLFLAAVFFIQSWPQPASAQISCLYNGNYTRDSTYAVNLNATFSVLTRDLRDSGFANASVGSGAGRANAVVLCRGDALLDACQSCIQESADELLRSCPNMMHSVSWDDRCMLWYSNAITYGAMATSPMWIWWNPKNVKNPDQFEEVVRGLLERLRIEVPSGNSLRKVAFGNALAQYSKPPCLRGCSVHRI